MDAQVVCTQLGYPSARASELSGIRYTDNWNLDIMLDEVACTGREKKISDCPNRGIGVNNCFHVEDASVVCNTELTNPVFEFIPTGLQWVGRLQVSWNDVGIDQVAGICVTDMNTIDASVACKQLGFMDGAYAYSELLESLPTDMLTVFSDITCDGTETTLLDCVYSSVIKPTCDSRAVAGLVCVPEIVNPTIRLAGDATEKEGLIEVVWTVHAFEQSGGICSTTFTLTEAKVACKQLGFFDALEVRSVTNPLLSTPYLLYEGITCTGEETNLNECTYTSLYNKNCPTFDYASIVCVDDVVAPTIRLVDGADTKEGRLEVAWTVNGIEQTGGICSADVTLVEAKIACKQLGFIDAIDVQGVAITTPTTPYILFEGIDCTGTEADITQCPITSLYNRNCPTGLYASIVCIAEPVTTFQNGDVRLSGPDAPVSGKVEVYFDGEWGTVCDDSWDIMDAQVVCTQLGFPSATAAILGNTDYTSNWNLNIMLDEVQCTGLETRLSDCRNDGVKNHNCFHIEDASVVCREDITNPVVSLVASEAEWSGPVMVTWNDVGIEQTAGICSTDFDLADGRVICHQLGYVGVASMYDVPMTTAMTTLFTGLQCSGTETDLFACPRTTLINKNCEAQTIAAVQCIPDVGVATVRLTGDYFPWAGRVDLLTESNGVSTTAAICNTDFDLDNAAVICGQLGFIGVQKIFATEGTTSGLTFFKGLDCNGTETDINTCAYSAFYNDNCPTGLVANVICIKEAPKLGDVRLVGSDSTAEGRVEVFHDGQWGTVCDDSYDIYDAQVICHQLGFPSAQRAITGDIFGRSPYGQADSQQNIWLDDLRCFGNETKVTECPSSGLGTNNCFHNEDVAVICNTGLTSSTVRLVGGSSPWEGRVEVLWTHQGVEMYGTICDDKWTIEEARVICRQLGFFDATAAYGQAFFGEGAGMILLDDVACTGTETDIVQCAHGYWMNTDCVSAEDAGVVCMPAEPIYTAGKIKLTGGANEMEGQVEIFYEEWGVICDDGWDIYDAQVVCHELGFPSARKATVGSFFGTTTMEYWLSGVSCDGSEINLDACINRGVGVHDCPAGVEAAGVVCNTDDYKVKVKLTDGPTPHEGMLTIKYGKTFGPVCDDSFDLKAADVVCRELGFFKAEKVLFNTPFVIPTSPFVLDDVICTGAEQRLTECAHEEWMVHDCLPEEAVGVKCIPVDEGHDMWDVRFVNGTVPSEGNVEVYMNRMWTSLCAPLTLNEAQVMCKQLGFPSAQGITEPNQFVSVREDNIKVSITCVGDETTLTACNKTIIDFTTQCDIEPVGIICNTGPQEVAIALVNGGIPSAGRLEVFYNGEYGTVCDDYFTMENAQVACRQLGFAGAKMLAPEAHFGEGTGPIVMDNVRCIGTETNLAQCSHKEWTVHDCNHREDVGIMCYRDFESINIELTGNFVRENEGIAVVTVNDTPGYICGDSFDMKDADVICKTMGYGSATMALNKTLGSVSTTLSNLTCTGKETSLLDCDHSTWFNKTCISNTVAFVSCKLPEDGDIRLMDGATSLQGRLELYYNGKWGLVCDDEFDMDDAMVACLELGFGAPVEYKNWPFGSVPFNVPIWVDSLDCTRDNVKISECQRSIYGDHDCTSVENVGIVCGEVPPITTQLLDGPFNSLGTIIITTDVGTRFQICSPQFTLANGMVLCSQMGYRGAAQVFQGNYFGTAAGRTIAMDFNCVGNEKTIAACPGFEVIPGRTCPVKEATSLVCLENEPLPIRLTGGPSPSEGRVEIKYGSKYGTVCDDSFTLESATVVCKSLGFRRALSFRSAGYVFRFDDSMPIWLDNVVCKGTEPTLENCLHNGFSTVNCDHEEDIIVTCTDEEPEAPDTETIPEGTLRLVNTTTMNDGMFVAGRLEAHFGSWGTICGTAFDLTDATTACKQLGFHKAVTVYREAAFGAGTGEIWISYIVCPIGATSFETCTYTLGQNGCTHEEDVAIACVMEEYEMPIRLVGGEWFEGEGRVEIEVDGVWGTVCSDGWDLNDANTVCQTLGFPGAAGRVVEGNFGQGTGPIHISNVGCAIGDERLALCPHNGIGVTNCDHTKDAGVVCRAETRASVSLAERISPFEGRVTLEVSGMDRSICFENFGVHEADVICRDLGFARHGLITPKAARNGVPIKGTKVKCSGWEATIGDCRMEFLNTINCQDELVVMVTCLPWENGDIRLADGHMNIEGRLEYFNGEWGTVCDDKWDIQDANVACRQLGFSKAKAAMTQSSFGEGTGPIWLDDVNCEGLERIIGNCQQNVIGDHNCQHAEDAGVVCEMSVRLTGGRDPLEGRVEINYNGAWGTVCADGFDMLAANVVCRQVGFTRAVDVKLFRPGTGPIMLDEVECEGTETQLGLCAHNGFAVTDCIYDQDIGIRCA
ncbi:scavenger receptor cysteine-rich type 1 protein M160-like isoform X3 [Apostichopus japonicus]